MGRINRSFKLYKGYRYKVFIFRRIFEEILINDKIIKIFNYPYIPNFIFSESKSNCFPFNKSIVNSLLSRGLLKN